MISKMIVQAVFCVHIFAISTTGREEAKEAASIIINTLQQLQSDVDNKLQSSSDFHQPFANNPDIDSNSDTLRTMYGMKNSFLRNREDMKAKRSWEDVSLIWRKSPKRAWEVVNRLWQNPEIRRKYRSYIENGKRSDELMENIPVQQNNNNPSWIIDELGLDTIIPVIVNSNEWQPGSTKRGWETINPTIWKSKKVTSKRTSFAKNNKRGWEELNWKRNTRGSILRRIPNQEPDAFNFDSHLLKTKNQGLFENQLPHPRSAILHRLLSYFLKNEDELASYINDDISAKIARYPIHRKNRFPYKYQENNEIFSNDNDLDQSFFQDLCRMLATDSTECRISEQNDQGPD